MSHVFSNLDLLTKDMMDKGWKIDSFEFKYKDKNYIVLVKLFEKKENEKVEVIPDCALVQLQFLEEDNFDASLSVNANYKRLLIDAKSLREFFGIEWAKNLGEILTQFNETFAKFIPTKVLDNKTQQEKKAMCLILDKSDLNDPNRIYCCAVRRNPIGQDGQLGQRSIFNDNKTRILRESLYKILGDDTNLSFVYSLDPYEEKTNEEIVTNWNRNKS